MFLTTIKGEKMTDSTKNNMTTLDLFQHYELQPKPLAEICNKYSAEENTYETCEAFLSEVQEIGYTFEYDLNAEPFNLTLANKATDAWTKAQEYRERMNEGRFCMIAPDFTGVVFFRTNDNGKPCAIGYKGRSKRAAFHYWYDDLQSRQSSVDKWLNELVENKRAKAIVLPRLLEVGDILVSSWGSEQTNIDYFKVVGLVGARSVRLVEIGAIKTHEEIDRGQILPDVNKVIGQEMTKRVDKKLGDWVRLSSFQSASKLDFELVDGAKKYRSHYWSSYA